MSRLIRIADWTGEKRANVVFVHGLGGHPYDTWQRQSDGSKFWPRWLAEDVKGLSVFSLGYVSPATNWIGTSMPILDEAALALRVLLNSDELKTGPIAFVCHSLGGLIVKQILRAANEQKRAPELNDLLTRTKRIVFIATPHTGAGGASLIERANFLAWGSASARDLVANKSELRDLNLGYRELATTRGGDLHHLVFYEMVDTLFGRIVKPDSADPGLQDTKPIPIRENHITIAKPLIRAELTYVEIKKFVAALAPEPTDPGKLRDYPIEPFDLEWSWQELVPKLTRIAVILLLVLGFWQGVPRIRGAIQALFETQSDVKETRNQVGEMKDLLTKLLAVSPAQASPSQERALAQTLDNANAGARGGDKRLERALELLNAQRVGEAQELFRTIAQEKAADARNDAKAAAEAFRNLGAIAGLSDPKSALEAYGKALEFDPDDREALYWYGFLSLAAENRIEAEKYLFRLLKIANETGDRRNMYRADLRLGELAFWRKNYSLAMEYENTSSSIARDELKANPGDVDWMRNLSAAEEKIGSILLEEKEIEEALKHFNIMLSVDEELIKSDPANKAVQRDHGCSYNWIGNALRSKGDLTGALENFRKMQATFEKLTQYDPNNKTWQRDLSVALEKVGQILVRQGNASEALAIFEAALNIRAQLVKSDSSNLNWQRDVAVLQIEIGDVLFSQGKIDSAQVKYDEAFATGKQLAKVDPANSRWQLDLAVSHDRIAKLLFLQGNKAAALENMKAALAIYEELAKTDPTNVHWQNLISYAQSMVANYEPTQDIAELSSTGSKISRDEVTPPRSIVKSTKRGSMTAKSNR
jgi:tetratricopeptide (TPR) repeat protein/pimeloyl-ACP methyl ester carboxylesterase